jgi:hypothetical protein
LQRFEDRNDAGAVHFGVDQTHRIDKSADGITDDVIEPLRRAQVELKGIAELSVSARAMPTMSKIRLSIDNKNLMTLFLQLMGEYIRRPDAQARHGHQQKKEKGGPKDRRLGASLNPRLLSRSSR